ncbi:MAG: peptidoglycan-associated lipoprotein Pal [Acidobacteriota bacterium]
MRRDLIAIVLALLVLLGLSLFMSGCQKKPPPSVTTTGPPTPVPAPVPEEPAPASAPTVSISASPSTVERGQQTTLSWESTDATSLVIDGGVGNVAEVGSIVISPRQSTTYTAVARGSGGEARSSTRVTVLDPRDRATTVSTDADRLQEAIDQEKVQPIFFAYDKADLSPKAMATLKANARWFRLYPEAKVVIEGHCDERGTEEYNLALGDRRALAARDYLLQLGVDPDRMETISFGEEKPFAKGHDEASYTLNRRAQFVAR